MRDEVLLFVFPHVLVSNFVMGRSSGRFFLFVLPLTKTVIGPE